MHPLIGVAVALASVTACGSGSSRPERSPTSADPPADRPAPPPTSSTVTETTLPADAAVVDGTGAVLVAPPDPGAAPVPVRSGDPCAALVDPAAGFECGMADAGAGGLAWVIDERTGTPGRRVTVFRLADGLATATLVVDDDGAQFARIVAVPGDIDGRPGDELVVGFRTQGSSAFLDLDVVGGDGTVVAHRSLDKGRAELAADGVRMWSARFGPTDDNCCPSAFLAERLTFDGARWRLAPSVLAPADQAPPGAFP
jgi:hypothetical protein